MSSKVLVVNDERHLCRLMEVALERAGYEVSLAYDGVEALEKVEEFEPDIIILDTMMPRMDGFEVIKRLRTNTATEDNPVLLTRPKSSDTCSDPMGDYYQMTAPPINPRLLVFCVQRILHGDEGEAVVSRR